MHTLQRAILLIRAVAAIIDIITPALFIDAMAIRALEHIFTFLVWEMQSRHNQMQIQTQNIVQASFQFFFRVGI